MSKETMERARDFKGYGKEKPQPNWPGGAKLAVSFVVNMEEGAEDCFEQGSATNDKFSEFQSIMPDGRRDLAMEQFHEYGLRAGVWRLLDVFERFDVKTTFWLCGRAVERSPEIAAEIVNRGHEPASHGYRWQCHAMMDNYDFEKAIMQRANDAIKRATGYRPYGFYGMWGPSMNTRNILKELGFVYDSNEYNDDLPYYRYDVIGGPMLVVPYSLDTNDFKFVTGDPFGAPSAFLEYLKRSVEMLLDEGRAGSPKMLNIGLHLRIIGRPARLWVIRELLAWLRSFGDEIWIAKRIDIANHWLKTHPPERR